MTLCILALFIQHAKRLRRIILSSVACLIGLYFSTLQKARFLGEKKLWDIKYVFFLLKLFSETFFSLRAIQRHIFINT